MVKQSCTWEAEMTQVCTHLAWPHDLKSIGWHRVRSLFAVTRAAKYYSGGALSSLVWGLQLHHKKVLTDNCKQQ